MTQALRTKKHDTIRQWAEKRHGHPATVKSTGDKSEAGILRIDFEEEAADENLESISWDEFFEKFDNEDLEFLYQEQTEDGSTSRFCKFVHPK